ncbi:MAG: SMP-30/gluconolactonase/LRE family protein [Nitrososphaerales archaeon]
MKYLALFVISLLAFGLLPAYAKELTKVTSFDPSASEAPEGIAVDGNGNVYIGLAFTGEVRKIAPDGSVSSFAQLPSPGNGFMTGLAVDSSGALFIALASFDENHGIWRVNADGSDAKIFASLTANGGPDGLPNALDFDNNGNLYASDTLGGRIWKIDQSGTVSVWTADPLLKGAGPHEPPLPPTIGANGIAFDNQKRNLYVANTDLGRIIKIPLGQDGSAGVASVFAEDQAGLGGADGITFDRDGNLYVALVTQDKVVVILEGGGISTIAEGPPLQNPAVVRFGADGNENTLYITNFAMLRFLGLVEETPEPSIFAIETSSEGSDGTMIAIITGIILLLVAAIGVFVVSRRKLSTSSKGQESSTKQPASPKPKKK